MSTFLDELLIGLGYEYDPEDVKKFNDDISVSLNLIGALIKTSIAAATAMAGITVASTQASDEQGKFADEIGISVSELDAWQFSLQRAGGRADGMSNSLQQLAIRISEASRGTGAGIEVFGLLGISIRRNNGELKTSSELLVEISKEFDGLDKSKQIDLADKLGIRDSIRLLQQGPDEIASLNEEAKSLGVTIDKDAKLSAEFQDSLTNLWQISKQVARTLSQFFAPILSEITNSFVDWWKTNKELIQQNIPGWIENLTKVMKGLALAVGFFIAFRFASHLVSLISILRSTTLSVLALNASIFLLPALLFTLGTAFIALVEDAKVFFDGGDSFIGEMIEKFPEWKAEIITVAAALATVADITGKIFEGWSGIFDLFKTDNLFDTLKGITSDQFILHQLGLSGVASDISNSVSNASSTVVDKIEIIVQGSANSLETASAVFDIFKQTTNDLSGVVDQ